MAREPLYKRRLKKLSSYLRAKKPKTRQVVFKSVNMLFTKAFPSFRFHHVKRRGVYNVEIRRHHESMAPPDKEPQEVEDEPMIRTPSPSLGSNSSSSSTTGNHSPGNFPSPLNQNWSPPIVQPLDTGISPVIHHDEGMPNPVVRPVRRTERVTRLAFIESTSSPGPSTRSRPHVDPSSPLNQNRSLPIVQPGTSNPVRRTEIVTRSEFTEPTREQPESTSSPGPSTRSRPHVDPSSPLNQNRSLPIVQPGTSNPVRRTEIVTRSEFTEPTREQPESTSSPGPSTMSRPHVDPSSPLNQNRSLPIVQPGTSNPVRRTEIVTRSEFTDPTREQPESTSSPGPSTRSSPFESLDEEGKDRVSFALAKLFLNQIILEKLPFQDSPMSLNEARTEYNQKIANSNESSSRRWPSFLNMLAELRKDDNLDSLFVVLELNSDGDAIFMERKGSWADLPSRVKKRK